jgi:hypothetical protein
MFHRNIGMYAQVHAVKEPEDQHRTLQNFELCVNGVELSSFVTSCVCREARC